MSRYRLPAEFFEDLNKLSEPDDDVFEEMRKAISEAPLTLSMDELIEYVLKSTGFTERETIEAIVRMTLSLDRSARLHGTTTVKLLEELSGEFRRNAEEGNLAEGAAKSGYSRLLQLVNLPGALKIISKAMNVFYEHSKLLQDVRILTDIRPVFIDSEDQKTTKLSGGTIVHTMKLSYIMNGASKEIYIALDEDDLEKLDSVVRRANNKASQLRVFLNDTDLPFISESSENPDE